MFLNSGLRLKLVTRVAGAKAPHVVSYIWFCGLIINCAQSALPEHYIFSTLGVPTGSENRGGALIERTWFIVAGLVS